jgi:hypothetical protein
MSDVTYINAILMKAHNAVLSFLCITIVSVKTEENSTL